MYVLKICFLFLFLSCSQLTADISHSFQDDRAVLCADIGSTRFKAAVLHPEMNLQDLQTVRLLAFPSEGWLGNNVVDLLNPFTPGS